MRSLLLVLIILCSFDIYSQTKVIAHRSHSGKNADLHFDGADNFGLPPNYQQYNISRDTITIFKTAQSDDSSPEQKIDSSKSDTVNRASSSSSYKIKYPANANANIAKDNILTDNKAGQVRKNGMSMQKAAMVSADNGVNGIMILLIFSIAGIVFFISFKE